MSENETFDLVVIGGGPAGYVASIRAAQLGLKTACIEKRKTLGGTCLNVGCIPSKALLDSSEHFDYAKKKLGAHGVEFGELKLNLPQMLKRKDDVVQQLTTGISGLLKKNRVTHLNGFGKLTHVQGELKKIEVDTGSEKQTLSAKNVLLATGSEPIELPFLPFDGKQIISSTEALNLPKVPDHFTVIGAGFIGLEMGSVWLRLGSKVTVVEFQDQILPSMDHQAGKELQKILTRQGFKFLLGTKCLGANKEGDRVKIQYENVKSGEKGELETDVTLVSTGRRPFTDGLGLQEQGIEVDERGRVKIDAHFRTNAPGVYAVGDIVAGPMLAHKAEEEGIAAVEIMAGQSGHVNYEVIPGVVYTWPELAAVGATEEELKAKGVEYRAGSFPFLANGRAKAMGEKEGFVKVLADAKTDRVLGVHILGPRASDMISEAASVMEFGGSAEDIARTCHAHPTLSEVLKEAALDVEGRKIHL